MCDRSSSGGGGVHVQSPRHLSESSWDDKVDADNTSVEGNSSAEDSTSRTLSLQVSHKLSLKDTLQKDDRSSLEPLCDLQASHPPLIGSGFGRGQLKQTFQQYLSKKGIQLPGGGHAALYTEGHKHEAWQKGELDDRQSAINVGAARMLSFDGRQEKTLPAVSPPLASSLDSKSESFCHDITGTESEIETEPKRKPHAESEMETESCTVMPPNDVSIQRNSFLFQLLEASHSGCSKSQQQSTSQDKPTDLSEKYIASLQKKIGCLEVSNN